MQSSSVTYRKEAVGPDELARLRNEVEVLKLVAHPNVVEVLGSRIGNKQGSLRLAAVSGTNLADCQLELEELASIALSTSATLAHIHETGVAHCSIDGHHLIVRDDHRSAVFCGFSQAVIDADGETQLADVADLGAALRLHLPESHDVLRRRINGTTNVDLTFKLSALIELACNGNTPAHELAQRFRSVVEKKPESSRRVRLPRWLAAAAILPLLLVGFAVSTLSGNKAEADEHIQPRVAPCHSIAKDLLPIDTDGDGCPNAVGIFGGNITIDDQHYAVGTISDRSIVGDWFGTGAATLAVLRGETGELFVFKEWPGAGLTSTATLLTTVLGATDVTSQRVDGHDIFIVKTNNGDVPFDAKLAR